MSIINNLIKDHGTECDSNLKDNEEYKPKPAVKSALDLQRLKLEKLMKNPEKLVLIPESKKEKDFMQSVPTFVRNVMGSSAGAGSGEFHVYRHLRRKEYARQKMIQLKSHQELLDEEYQQKLQENLKKSEEKTAKKRAKRLRKKVRVKTHRNLKTKLDSDTDKNKNCIENSDSTNDDFMSNDLESDSTVSQKME